MAMNVPDSIGSVYRPFWTYKPPPVYRAIVRDFGNGQCEVLTHTIQHRPSEAQLINSDLLARGGPMCAEWRAMLDRQAEARGLVARPAAAEGETEKSAERSVRRAKQVVRWRIKGQGLNHMLTLTYRENMTDRKQLKRDWARFLRLVKEKSGGAEWPYVAAVETQERGALHLHVAVRGRQDVHKLRGLWYLALGAKVKWSKGVPSCIGMETPGNIDVKGPRRGVKWNPRKLAGYLSKYIGKEMALIGKNERRYWAPTGWECPKSVVFLRSQDLLGALIETADLFESITGCWGSPWRSPDWACLWVST